ncbi:MAG: formyltetrahydrofolate deformylase [Phycisphaerales bacterium]|jgi:formyltetrahydrofolate deformylase
MDGEKIVAREENCRVLISCADGRGIVAAVSGLIARLGGNILDADQHTELGGADGGGDLFFMRVVAQTEPGGRETLAAGFDELAQRLSMRIEMHWGDRPERVVILAGKETHCLSDLLWRYGQGELACEVVGVISNHDAGRAMCSVSGLGGSERAGGVPFEVLPVLEGEREAQERALGDRLEAMEPDLVVLARYMRVLPEWLVQRYAGRMINIHHGFLPAFAGARPYHQAHARGVKLIGATSHYVTAELDQGPIIAQDTRHVSHRDGVDSLVRLGRDLERMVLAKAVRQHLERRVLVVGRRTVVFE